MRSLLVLAICSIVFGLPSFAAGGSGPFPPIANADFQAASKGKPASWRWWSRLGVGSVRYVADEGHGTLGAAKISHDGEQDFALSNKTRIAVTPGQSLKVSAWVKPIHGDGDVELAIVGLTGRKVLDWRIGYDMASDADRGRWTKLTAKTVVPVNCDTIYVRFVGKGHVETLVDDVSIETWDWKKSKPGRTKVKGFASKRVEEKLDRGLVVRRLGDDKVYLSWRLLKSDPEDIGFNVYLRSGLRGKARRFNSTPIVKTTDYLATLASKTETPGTIWSIRPVVDGREQAEVQPACVPKEVVEPDKPIVIPMRAKDAFQKVGIADLDGDGSLDYVLKRPGSNIDPYDRYWHKSPGTIKLDAYKNDGTPLWVHDLGWSIEQGIWYSPFLVYDFDGDGQAEVVAKTGVGDPRDDNGRVKTGKEFVSVFDGLTGKTICQAPWPTRKGFGKGEGDGGRGYNVASRNQLGVAYLDGKTPCLIVARGTYGLMKVVAYQLHHDELEELWRWDNRGMPSSFRGQGAHWMHAADVDHDGRDEVILGSVVLDDSGTVLWTTGMGHPDHCYVGDIDPTRPGLEIYYGIERRSKKNGMCLVDAATGKILWGHDKPTTHIHTQGLCSDLDASHPGAECFSGERDTPKDRWLRSAKGKVLDLPANLDRLNPKCAYWDADPQREIVGKKQIASCPDGEVCGKIRGTVVQVADVLGDWREEIITSVDGEIRIYMTTIPATDRRPCLMQDPIYRIDVAHGAMGYTQVPMLGYDMASEAGDASGSK